MADDEKQRRREVTKQGVRDLGNNRSKRLYALSACTHSWETERQFDCHLEDFRILRRCGLCHDWHWQGETP